MNNSNDENFEKLKEFSKEVGFSRIAISDPNLGKGAPSDLEEFLRLKFHGDMDWLLNKFERRSDPVNLWPQVKSIIMVSDSYSPLADPLAGLSQRSKGNISVYAHGHDYHNVMKKKLRRLASWILSNFGGEVKIFVDTAPVMEKPLAQAAGLGWQGKHTNLVSRLDGNWFFLGSVFSTIDMPKSLPETDKCGSCNKCLEICPTQAFPKPYQLDARKCISYLTIEHKGPVDYHLRSKLGNRIYGCDDCLAICPWNKFAKEASEIKYFSKSKINLLSLEFLASLNETDFREKFSGSPIKRIGRERFVRNVLYAIGNSREQKLLAVAKKLVNDDSFVIKDAAIWASERLINLNE